MVKIIKEEDHPCGAIFYEFYRDGIKHVMCEKCKQIWVTSLEDLKKITDAN